MSATSREGESGCVEATIFRFTFRRLPRVSMMISFSFRHIFFFDGLFNLWQVVFYRIFVVNQKFYDMFKAICSYFRKRKERKLRERFAAIMLQNNLSLNPEYLEEVVGYVMNGGE